MYSQFYGFHEKPFSLLPDPEFLFLSDKHEKALNLLELGIHNQSGFCVISGEIGAGKTTLVRELLNRLDERVCTGLIANTHSTFSDLLGWILAAYELKCESNEAVVRHRCFSDFVIAQYAQGKHTLLIIDEAQNLSLSALEQLRMLSNINSDKDLVLQIILIGQSELRAKLQQPELEQFAQRIAIDYHLTALDQEETSEYIQHRVTKSGGTQQLFDADARRLVYQRSGGIPRVINRICDLSLVYGFSENRKVIGAELIKAVTAQQKMDPLIDPLDETPVATPAPATQPGSAARPLKTAELKPAAKAADRETEASPTHEPSHAPYAEAEKATANKTRAESILIEKNGTASTLVEKSRADATAAEKAASAKLAAEKEAAEKATARQAAAALAEASMTAAKLAETEKLAAEKAASKAASAAEQAAGIIADKKQKADKLIAEKARIEKAALQDAAEAKAAAGKAVAERIAAEKAAAETEAAAETAAKKAAANRAAAEKVAADMVHDSETAAARTLSTQTEAERVAAEKISAEKAAAEKARADAARAEKAATETAAATSAAQEKAVAAKQAVEQAAASHAAAEKALAEKAAADKVAKQKASLEKIALAKVAASVAAAAQQAADEAAQAKIAAQKEASDKEAAAIAAARKAAEASALAEAAAADSVAARTSNTSDLQLVEKPDGGSHPPSADHQPPADIQEQIQAAHARTRSRRTRSFLALSTVAVVVAASGWLITRQGDMGATLNSLVVAGQSFVNSQPVTEAAALETVSLKPGVDQSESQRQP